LFTVKNRWGASLLILAVLFLGSVAARASFDLPWRLVFGPSETESAAVGLGLILLSDAVVGLTALWLGRAWFRMRMIEFAYLFRSQRVPDIVAGSLLAGFGEELLFRGVIQRGLITCLGLPPPVAIGLTALLFGLAHHVRGWGMAPMAAWAALQGVWLGLLFHWSGSLSVNIAAHSLHDAAGFVGLAIVRRWGLPAVGKNRGNEPRTQSQNAGSGP
jgi:membrane protease YdiL (CAAX protease family)